MNGLATEADLPPHLVGIPQCLHKYEPVLRRLWNERDAQPESERSPSP